MDCKELLSELLVMLDDIANNRIVEVDEFTYVKNAQAAQTDTEAATEA